MDDFLAEGKPFRRIAEILRLPIPLPPKLQRAKGPMTDNELTDKKILLGGVNLLKHWQQSIETLGAKVEQQANNDKYGALVYDATQIITIEQLTHVYQFFHENIRKVDKCGRVIVIGQTGSINAEAGAAQKALEGFCRALGKEVGKKGITVNLVHQAKGAEHNTLPVLRFLLSNRSAFISGQVFNVSAESNVTDNTYLQPLQGKTAIVTGGARGIGKTIAQRLAEEGALVIVVDRQSEEGELKAVAADIKGKYLVLDITDTNATNLLTDYLKQNTQGLDILIHNAGITRDKTLANMTEQQWQQVLQVNLAAAIRINNALLGKLINDYGRIICMASISGIGGNFGQTNYSASKAGLIGYVASLANELASRGITANAIAPGFIETQMTAKVPFFTREAGRRLNSLAQGGLPIDVAELVTFLATPAAKGINGQTIRVCGGNIMGA